MEELKIYHKTNCPYAAKLMKILDKKGIKYTDIDFYKDPEAKKVIVNRNGRFPSPQVEYNGVLIYDYTTEEDLAVTIEKMLKDNTLSANKIQPKAANKTMDTTKATETLSDLVFGLALTIGTLSLIGNISATQQDVLSQLVLLAFSFLIIIFIWYRYTRLFEILVAETDFEIMLNIAMLFLVIIEPYLFNLLTAKGASLASLDFSSTLFGADIAGIMIILALFYTVVINECTDTVSEDDMYRYVQGRNGLVTGAAIFLFSLLPFFWNTSVFGIQLRFAIWLISLAIAILITRVIRKHRKI